MDIIEQGRERQCPKHWDHCFSMDPAEQEMLRLYPFSAALSELFGDEETMLDAHWIDLSWFNNEHLYYALRRAYGDFRRLLAARGHRFLEYEVPERTTFLHLALMGRWTFWMTCSTGRLIIEGQKERLVVSSKEPAQVEFLEQLFYGGSEDAEE
jgi:hypothetical protein